MSCILDSDLGTPACKWSVSVALLKADPERENSQVASHKIKKLLVKVGIVLGAWYV